MNIGIESASNKILESSGKKNPEIEHQEHIIGYLQKKGVRINSFFMLGLTGDTPETMRETINYAKRLKHPRLSFVSLPLFREQACLKKLKTN